MNKYWIGVDKKITDKVYTEDITEFYNKFIDEYNESTIFQAVANNHEGFMHFFTEAEDAQQAVDIIVDKYFKRTNLKSVK